MDVKRYPLTPPPLEELVEVLKPAFEANYAVSSVSVFPCPDLRQAPYHLAAEGLSGQERIAEIGGGSNLFPVPKLHCQWSLPSVARAIDLPPSRGFLLGAGAGPFPDVGVNSELAPNLSWTDGYENLTNLTTYTRVDFPSSSRADSSSSLPSPPTTCAPSPSANFALMMNLYASTGLPGPVLRLTACQRTGPAASLPNLVRETLAAHYGPSRAISLGGIIVLKRGKGKFHVMPDFPNREDLPFRTPEQVNSWLTWHEFEGPVVGLTVVHAADPGEEMGLRLEHTHCFGGDGSTGGHYHGDVAEEREEVEYEAYLNVAREVWRIDRPEPLDIP